MKTLVLFLIAFVFLFFQTKGQTPYNINNVNGTTITSCNAILYDSGGPAGTYQNSEDYSVTFCSGTTDCILLHFTGTFALETNWEHLYIYDGNSTSANLLRDLDGAALPADITTSGNCVTIRFTSDGSVTQAGFQMNISCTGTCYVPPPPPTNDDPCTAFALTVNATCNFTEYTCQNATGTAVVPAPSCAVAYLGGDVWFSAVVPAGGLSVSLGAGMMTDAGIAIYSGATCNSLTEIMCNEPWSGIPPTQTLGGGSAGQTVWIRVWEPDNDNAGTFNICGFIPPPPPANDEPCAATPMTVNTTCVFTSYTTASATGTISIPAPSCATAYSGGDVWFSAVVPASGLLAIQLGAQVMTEAGIAIYSGANCNALTEVSCNEQTWGMPTTQYIGTIQGLAGQTVWIRVWEPDNDNQGTFNICAYEPPPFLEVTTTTYTPQQLIQDILVTGCLVASNVVYDGPPVAIGAFNNGSVFGFQSGIIMGSGAVGDICGDDTFGDGLLWTTSSNDVLANISTISASNGGSTSIYDQVMIEFDFVPSSAVTEFKFVFASDEYPTFEHTSYNDVFGFFVSGPGIAGPYADAAINVAVVPSTTIPITISTINGTDNSSYFAGYVTAGPEFNTGGYTVPITATMSGLTPCQTYHIKFVIADAGDGSLNSYVMFDAASFTSGGEVAVDHFSSFPVAGEVLEGCDNYYVFSRIDTTDLTDSIHVQLNISGTAINGTDYTPIPTSFWILPGVISDTVFYSAILDNLVEPTEYIVLSLTNGCPCNVTTVTDTIYILNNFNFNPQISNDTTVCSGQPVTITTTVNPNIDPTLLTYLWSTGASTTNITVNPTVTTTYYVTINDPCAQDTVLESTVTMVPPLTPSFTISSDTICLNETVNISFNGTAGPNAIYQWDFNGGTPATAATQGPHNVFWTTSGQKTITLSMDDNGCTGTTTKQVEVLSNPTVTLTPSPALCFGTNSGSISVTETGQNTPYTYIWNNGSTLQNPLNLIAGNYTVTVSNAYGCSITSTTAISQPTLLTLSTNSTPVSCFGGNNGTASAIVNGGTIPYIYLWNDPLNQNTSIASSLIAGTYQITITDANGCTRNESVIITQPVAALSLTSTLTNISCAGSNNGSIVTETTGGTLPYSYSWSHGENTSSIYNLPAGSFTVTVTDANGCTYSNTWSLTEPVALSYVGLVTPVSCYGTSDGSIAFTVSNGTPPYNYLWSNQANTSSLTNTFAGNYQVTVTDANNCTITASYTIAEPQKVTVSITGDQTICLGQSTSLMASVTGGTAPYVLHWNNGSNQTSITVSPTTETSYELFATDSKSCQSNVTFATVHVNPIITASYQVSSSSICIGEKITINVLAQGGNGNYTYLLNGVQTQIPITLYPALTQSYNILVQDDCGSPTALLSVLVNVKPLPSIDFYADSIEGCVPLTVHFIEVNPSIGQTYLWNFGDDSYNETSTEKNPIHKFNDPGTYDVDLQVISPDGCKNHFTQMQWINVYPQAESHFIAEPNRASFIKPIIHFINMSSNSNASYWSFGDGDSSQFTNPWHTFPTVSGYYNVDLISQTEHGCRDTSSLLIEIVDEYTFYAPTAFSPDNDGKNDFFFVLGHGIVPQTFKLQIYDRWGGIIWETTEYTDQWNGKNASGKTLPIGTYAWLVHYKDNTGIAHEYSGHVTIIR